MKEINLKFLKSRRNELKLSMQEMADALGFKNASTYLKYENGEYKFKANHLPIISEMFNCKMEDLFFNNKISEIEIKGSNTA